MYKYNDKIMSNTEVLQMVIRRLGESCGDLGVDLDYLEAIDRLEEIDYSPERRAKRRWGH